MNDVARRYLTLFSLKTLFSRCKLWSTLKEMGDVLILDVGCGEGGPVALVAKHNNYRIVGLDIFKPSLDKAKGSGTYQDLALADVRHLPFKDKSVDVAVSVAVLEHLDKHDGEKLLSELERVSRRMMVISCPVGKWEQESYDNNPYQEHKYVWSVGELRDKGFRDMNGVGLKGMSGKLWGSLLRTPIGLMLGTISLLGTLVSYWIPEVASSIVAWRRLSYNEVW